ncbi:MAG: NTP transferase domain-containing protein [candidate division Zixibacteria bacterium]|nr:NTP transferase domain-containing protein [candidate division Zixibacteria bacterium]
MTSKKAAIILAAGQGKRMNSDLPKVLHNIGGKPMIKILLDRLIPLGFEQIVVVIGYKGEQLQSALADYPISFAWQREQLGTGHAVQMAKDLLEEFEGTTLIAAGDVPFLSINSIRELFRVHQDNHAAATCLSAIFEDPDGYGRIIRDKSGEFLSKIVEHKDASDEIREINEINSGTFCFDNLKLFTALGELKNNNAQGEYYLTDTIKILNDKGLRVAIVQAENPDEVQGVNSMDQLEELAEKFVYRT